MGSFRDNFHVDKIGASLDIGIRVEEMLGTRVLDNIFAMQRLTKQAYGSYERLDGAMGAIREREAVMNDLLGYNNLVNQLLPRYEYLYAASDAIRYVNPIIESLRATESIRDFMISYDWVTQNTLADLSKSIGLSNSIYLDIVNAGRYVNDIRSLSDTIANSSLGLRSYWGVLQGITAAYEVAENLFGCDRNDDFNFGIGDADFSEALEFVAKASGYLVNIEVWYENFKTYLSDFIASFDKKKAKEMAKKIWGLIKALGVVAGLVASGLTIYTVVRDAPLRDAPNQNAPIIANIIEHQTINVTNITLNITSGWHGAECICKDTGEVKQGWIEDEYLISFEELFSEDDGEIHDDECEAESDLGDY